MPRSRLDTVASNFTACSEAIHDKFLTIRADSACTGCESAGLGEAILTAWLQTSWGEFNRALLIASALGTRRTSGTPIKPAPRVRSENDAEKLVNEGVTQAVKTRGLSWPVWHAPWFVIEVGSIIHLDNRANLQSVLGPTLVPQQITWFRNYLVHPGKSTRPKYEELQAKLGMLRREPEELLHQSVKPGLTVFTSWVRDLQQLAHDSTR